VDITDTVFNRKYHHKLAITHSIYLYKSISYAVFEE